MQGDGEAAESALGLLWGGGGHCTDWERSKAVNVRADVYARLQESCFDHMK